MEDTVFQEPSQTFPAPRRRNQKRLALFIVAVLIIVIFTIFISLANSGKQNQNEEKLTPTPTVEKITDTPTPTPEEETTPTPEETKTPTPKPTNNPIDKTTGLDRSELSVAVENGSGEAGVAGKAAGILKELGYKIASTGNADNYDYQNVTIKVKSSKSDYITLLKTDLGKNYTVGEASSDLSASVSADALVIVGK